jgi:hypothetical protein
MIKSNLSRTLLAGLVCGATLAASSSAFAGPKLFAYLNGSFTANGTTETTANGNVDPFNIEVFSAGNECLRIAVTAQQTDLEATLVAPDGRTWRDDDSNGSLRPLVKAITTKRGWHILRVSNFVGSAVNADFTFQVMRLPSTSSLCAGATTPISTLSVNTLKPQAAPTAPKAGGTR